MGKVLVMNEIFTGLAGKIRSKLGVTTKYLPGQMAAQIGNLPGCIPKGNLQLTNATTTYNVTNYATVTISTTNLAAANIRGGVSILGVAGKSSVKETNDANAAAADVLLNKTGYVNGSKITGSAKPTVSGTTVTFPSDWCR